jgi:hypothetical protein
VWGMRPRVYRPDVDKENVKNVQQHPTAAR